MLFLLFTAGSQRYAIPAARVVEVLPLLHLTRVPQAPAPLAGYFNYQGCPVSAVDLSALTAGRPAAEQLSTRIILVRHPAAPGPDHLLGLIAEEVTQTLKRPAADLSHTGVRLAEAPHLGPVFMDEHGAVQCIYEDRLLVSALPQPAAGSRPQAIL